MPSCIHTHERQSCRVVNGAGNDSKRYDHRLLNRSKNSRTSNEFLEFLDKSAVIVGIGGDKWEKLSFL